MTRFKTRLLSIMASLASAVSVCAHAEPYPAKPIAIVVPQAAGGASDVTARLLAQQLSVILKQSVVVENKPGAGGNIGTVAVARAKADGYTLLFNQTSQVINPALYSKAGYDNERDFTPVAAVADGAFLLVASSKSEIKSVDELLARAKRQPGEVRYGSAGNGTLNHLAGAMLEKAAQIDLLHVPYRGGAESAQGLAAGDVDIAFQAPASAQPLVQTGRVRVLALTNPQRPAAYATTPTVAETVRGYEVTPWYGLFAPKATPEPVVQALNAAVNKALAVKELQDKLAQNGLTPTPRSTAEFARMVADEAQKWQRAVKASGATID